MRKPKASSIQEVVEPILPGYSTGDGMWAAIPFGKTQYMIIHNGSQVHIARTLTTAKTYITKEMRKVKNETCESY